VSHHMLASSADISAVKLGSTTQHGVKLGSSWGQHGVNLGSTWDQHGVNLGSIWGQAAPPYRDDAGVVGGERGVARHSVRRGGVREHGVGLPSE